MALSSGKGSGGALVKPQYGVKQPAAPKAGKPHTAPIKAPKGK
jgi:hypothetical protein